MSLGFTTPALLLGAAAALIPLLVHLLRRRPPLPTSFPALVLLLGPAERQAQRRRLRELLLLATRMLLLAAVAATLAGPFLSRPVAVPPTAAKHQAAVIVVDDTLSMRFRRDGGTLFEEARRRARALLQVLPATAPVSLITVTDRGAQITELSLDRDRLRRAVDRLAPTSLAGSGGDALARAARLLEAAPPGAPKAIYLITDLTRTGLTLTPGQPAPDTALQVLDVAGGELPNRAVVAAALVAEGAAAGSAPTRIRARVRNATGAPAPLTLQVRADGRRLTVASVTVPPHATRPVELTVAAGALPRGARFLSVGLEAADALAEDDQRLVPVGRAPRLRVLLVDGDPRETRHDDELFYLEAALRALATQVRLELRVVAGADLEGATFERDDLVVLANVAAPSRGTVLALESFVRRGGALLVALGDQVDPDAYNQTLGVAILPARLRSLRSGGASGPGGPPALVDADQAAPALRSALDAPESRRALRASRVRRYGLLARVRGDVLLRLDSGAPLLVSQALGAGRVLLFTSTLDRDWNDLVHRPAFLPLLRGVLALLTGHSAAATAQVVAGRPATLRALPGEQLLLLTPGRSLRALPPAGPDGTVIVADTEEPGAYRVFVAGPGHAGRSDWPRSRRGHQAGLGAAPEGPAGPGWAPAAALAATTTTGLQERPALAFAVVADPAESDLRRLPRAPSQPGRLGGATGGGGAPQATVRQDLGPWLALLCLLLLLVEALLAARFRRWRAPPDAP